MPRVASELFEFIDSKRDDHIAFEVVTSMIEIYKEQIRDLLNDKKQGGRGSFSLFSILSFVFKVLTTMIEIHKEQIRDFFCEKSGAEVCLIYFQSCFEYLNRSRL